MKAYLKNYRQSPRKVRLLADLIKGKSVDRAMAILGASTKRASDPMQKLLASAVANAKNNFNTQDKELFVKDLRVDEGVVLKRQMPRARGSAFQILKRTSHVTLLLDEHVVSAPVSKVAKGDDKKADKAPKTKVSRAKKIA